MLTIKLSEKKRKALEKKYQQQTAVDHERLPESQKGGLLGECLNEKEEWIFIIERFAALEWERLLLG
jgi:hypothetical protein